MFQPWRPDPISLACTPPIRQRRLIGSIDTDPTPILFPSQSRPAGAHPIPAFLSIIMRISMRITSVVVRRRPRPAPASLCPRLALSSLSESSSPLCIFHSPVQGAPWCPRPRTLHRCPHPVRARPIVGVISVPGFSPGARLCRPSHGHLPFTTPPTPFLSVQSLPPASRPSLPAKRLPTTASPARAPGARPFPALSSLFPRNAFLPGPPLLSRPLPHPPPSPLRLSRSFRPACSSRSSPLPTASTVQSYP
ncbi:hypothetical protein BC628DRAFT_232346 [Trametes gibbosa]|nr:hypothetical protein BC628DRAFT_232346 [Trametes gibbosa]